MPTYVIVRNEDGKYVAMPGSKHSYTTRLEFARTFSTREAAQADCCGNERAVPIENLLRSA